MHMKIKKAVSGSAKADFVKNARGLYPVARGALTQVNKRCNNKYCKACKSGIGHPSWIFTFRKDGKQRCMHVQPRHVEIIRTAIDNGRRLEAMILDEGIALLERLREQE